MTDGLATSPQSHRPKDGSPLFRRTLATLSIILPVATIVTWASSTQQRHLYFAISLFLYTATAFAHRSLAWQASSRVWLVGFAVEVVRMKLENSFPLAAGNTLQLCAASNLLALSICSLRNPIEVLERLHQDRTTDYFNISKVFLPILWPKGNRSCQTRLAIVAFLLTAQRVLEVVLPWQLGSVIEHAGQERHTLTRSPWISIATYILLQWLQSPVGIRLAREYAVLPVRHFAQQRIAEAAFSHVLALDMSFHMDKDSTEIIRSTDQAEEIGELIEFAMFDCIPLICDLGVACVFMYSLVDGYIVLIIIATAGFAILINTSYRSVMGQKQKIYAHYWRSMHQAQADKIANYDTVLRHHQQQHESSRYRKLIQRYHSRHMDYSWAYLANAASYDGTVFVGQAVALCWGFRAVQKRSTTLSAFVALCTILTRIGSHLSSVSKFIRKGSKMMLSAERLAQILNTTSPIVESPSATPLRLRQGYIEYEQVSFTYPRQRQPVLSEVTVAIQPGEVVAVVGRSGSGKSTMANLLGRFFDLDSGRILIDSQDIRTVTLQSLRSAIGWVTQECTLFNTNILENVRYGRPGASEAEVETACRKALIHEKIASLPQGYRTEIGERGVKLSGGERQRLTIARMLLNDHPIIVLDEATSALNTETENVIKGPMKTHFAGKTVLIIAHRLSTIREADKILVLHQGTVIEWGSHDELLKRKGRYSTLWSEQVRGSGP